MLPSERGNVAHQVGRDRDAPGGERIEGGLQVARVPQDDSRDQQVQPRGAEGLVLERAVAQLAQAVEEHLARAVLLPALPKLLACHPALTVHLGEGERFVDLVREGVDCVVRAGELIESDMVVRRLGTMDEITVASPAYLAQHGMPATPEDLDGHQMIGFVSSRTGQALPLEFTRDGHVIERSLPARILVGGADTSAAAARLGMGLVQAPRYRFSEDLASGTLIEVLAKFPPTPTQLSVLYPSNRQLSPRVRVLIDWLLQTVGPRLGSE